MVFQPFGYRFEANSTKSPERVKADIRSGMKGWFDMNDGPRGWIIGPVICLWSSAFNRHGPMLLGWISSNNFGARVQGRAGSDLNGVAWAAVIFPLLALLLYQKMAEGIATTGQIVVIGGLFIVGASLTFWLAHKDRREADTLVNFVMRSL